LDVLTHTHTHMHAHTHTHTYTGMRFVTEKTKTKHIPIQLRNTVGGIGYIKQHIPIHNHKFNMRSPPPSVSCHRTERCAGGGSARCPRGMWLLRQVWTVPWSQEGKRRRKKCRGVCLCVGCLSVFNTHICTAHTAPWHTARTVVTHLKFGK